MKPRLKTLLALLILGIIFGISMYVFVYNKPHPDYEKATPFKKMTAAELFDFYRQQRQEADAELTGKVLEISGNVDKVEIHGDDIVVVFVFDDGDFGPEGVRCTMLPVARQATLQLITGDYITLKGYCTGYNETDVILEKCSFTE